ncbi:MAG: glycerophosphodiester phosphodiesterase [Flavobacteriales bacterium CG_4_9_14_3_um_filter_40_17]|nr:MAG: glycerophosphodiester phosphodiesterase [Flavobacteriales bacterium CG_4_9_14_3_um_filter_40_17]
MKNLFSVISIFVLISILNACKQNKETFDSTETINSKTFVFDLEGHRGARGLLPENTLAAFEKAIEIGVNTLEMDVVVTADHQLLVSHEPWFNRQICLDSLGQTIKDTLNIYKHTYLQTLKYDCGSLGNPNFIDQKKQFATKPLLKDVLQMVESYAKLNNQKVSYNIEIKSLPAGDNTFHPELELFADLLVALLENHAIPNDRLILQSFDFRVLQYVRKNYPKYRLAALVYKDDVQTNLNELGFTPEIYSPLHTLLTEQVVDEIHQKVMKVVPWTVNDTTRMRELLSWGVDGIITDFPNIAIQMKTKS